MSAGEEKQKALVLAQPSAHSKSGAKSLAARGRADLLILDQAEDWLRRGLEFRQQGIDDTQASFECTQQALDKQIALGRRFSSDEKLAFFEAYFFRDPRHKREEAYACFERGIQFRPNHPMLQFLLGEANFNGWGVPQNSGKAVPWFHKAALQGHADAQFYCGWICAGMVGTSGSGLPRDYVQAAVWWRKGAEQGHAESQSNLASFYLCGLGVEQDDAQADFWIEKSVEHTEDTQPEQVNLFELASWYRQAAEHGDANAQYVLGALYDNGRGVPQDDALAAAWLRKAAEQGNTDAKLAIGLAFKEGRGVPQDNAEAYFWLDLASAGTKGQAREWLPRPFEDLEAKLTSIDLSNAQQRVAGWSPTDRLRPEKNG